jgi:hypothetical protein
MPEMPFMDNNGDPVVIDRRKIPDRRLNSIQAEWLESYPRLWDH